MTGMRTQSRVLVTGSTGQDGSYLVERLIADGVEVHAVVRRPREDDARFYHGFSTFVIGSRSGEVICTPMQAKVSSLWGLCPRWNLPIGSE